MLGRTANNVYWMARYFERAENVARLLEASYNMSLLPSVNGKVPKEWEAPLGMTGSRQRFVERFGDITSAGVIEFMALSADNEGSIAHSIGRARDNARATRSELPLELWQGINQTWIDLQDMSYPRLVDQGFAEFFEWVKERSHLFRGMIYGTMRRGDAFMFARLGTFVERADNTARVLAAKWNMLTPLGPRVVAAEDYYRWGALLRSFSAFKAYREIYRGNIEPRRVAEMLILRDDMPRSLHACYDELCAISRDLRRDGVCARLAKETRGRIRASPIDVVLRSGLHRYLYEFLGRNNRFSNLIEKDFMMVP